MTPDERIWEKVRDIGTLGGYQKIIIELLLDIRNLLKK